MTPLRVAVEIAVSGERVWRLSEGITKGAIRLGKEVPFDRGARVTLRFELPGGTAVETQGEMIGEREVALDAEPPARSAIVAYLRDRAG